MIDIKSTISFDEYNAIINKVIEDCFVDGVYSPALYELSLRVSLISAFSPNFDLSNCEDNNALWEKVTDENNIVLIGYIKKTKYYQNIITAIDKGIQHRLRTIESSPMSLSDIALSKLFGVITDKIDSVDTDVINKNTIEALITANKQSGKEDFVDKLVDAMIDKGLISNPNRTTRKSDSNKSKDVKIVKTDTVSQDENESK